MKMLSRRTIIYVFLCILAQTKADSYVSVSSSTSTSDPQVITATVSGSGSSGASITDPSGETIVSQTGPGSQTVTIPTPPAYAVDPQDDLDAQAIIDAKRSHEAIASILPYRIKERRFAINQQIGAKSGGTVLIADKYRPQDPANSPFKNVCFGLMKEETIVLSGYLTNFFETRDETRIIIAMVLTKDIKQMMDMYDKYYSPKTFKEVCKEQKSPFESMLEVWTNQNREPDETGDLDKNQITQDSNDLKKENESGGWKETHAQIEKILIKKSIKYAQAVIAEFEKVVGKPIEEVIHGNVQSHQLDNDLADAYSSIAKYIKNKNKYIAEVLAQYCDGLDKWSTWIMSLAVVSPDEWPKIDAEFQKANKDESLSKFILRKMTGDKVMAEMIAAVMDPTFKPTTFTKLPPKQGAGPGPSPPPATPTTMAPPATP